MDDNNLSNLNPFTFPIKFTIYFFSSGNIHNYAKNKSKNMSKSMISYFFPALALTLDLLNYFSSFNASTPGRTLPSRNSNEAPPPVET